MDGVCQCSLSNRHGERSASLRKVEAVVLHQLSILCLFIVQLRIHPHNFASKATLKAISCNKSMCSEQEKVA